VRTKLRDRVTFAARKNKRIAGRLSESHLGDAAGGPDAISARLAEELNVTPPAVTAALKRMTRDGHVRVERSGRIDLTQKAANGRNISR